MSLDETWYVLAEIHEGVSRSHIGGRSLASKVTRAEYYWPHSLRDFENFARKCLKCQEHGPVLYGPMEELTSIIAPWPFAQWGLDLIGPIPVTKEGAKFMKWVEAEALASITYRTITKFLWKSVICRFGIP